jgi:hypothetical protein
LHVGGIGGWGDQARERAGCAVNIRGNIISDDAHGSRLSGNNWGHAASQQKNGDNTTAMPMDRFYKMVLLIYAKTGLNLPAIFSDSSVNGGDLAGKDYRKEN